LSSGVAKQVRIPCPQASQKHLLQYLFIYAVVYAFFLSCLSVRAYFYDLWRTFWIMPQCSLRPTLSLVTFSVLPSVPEVPRSCRQLHLHHEQGWQTVCQKCCNVEQGARAGRESQSRKKAKEVGRRRLQEDQFLRRAHACHGIRGSACNGG
jgi:hypothetical protein